MEVFSLFGFILGSILGSFVKALADRAVTNRAFWGRSYCEFCKRKLAWYDLFPVFSYLFLQGKCRYCKQKLSLEYLLVEVLMGFSVALLFYITFNSNFFSSPILFQVILALEALFKVFVISVLVALVLTDLKIGLIPDRITYPAIAFSIAYLLVITLTKIGVLYLSLSQTGIGRYLLPPHSDYFTRHALLNALPLVQGLFSALTIALFFGGLIFFTRGKGMGGGDLKLGIFLGLALGFPDSFLAIILAFLAGSIVGVLLLLSGKKHFGQTIPFGPFLALGGLLSLFWGTKLIEGYFKFKLF
ncbi:prepilin peptidase [Candidatus Daviesbacteria bacterium]|nr:prepilin peptidase [Candidatus Daviesbacteria bacterium]